MEIDASVAVPVVDASIAVPVVDARPRTEAEVLIASLEMPLQQQQQVAQPSVTGPLGTARWSVLVRGVVRRI